MSHENVKLCLPEYRKFLEYFYATPFVSGFKLAEKPTIAMLEAARGLEPTYFNSFYLFCLLRTYLESNTIDADLLYELTDLIFHDERPLIIKEDLEIHSMHITTTVDSIERNIELLEIEKYILGLKRFTMDDTIMHANFITNNVILIDAMDLKDNFVFMTRFLSKNINIALHKNITFKCVSFLNNLELGSFFSDDQKEDELNDNLDLLEVLLFFMSNYFIHEKNNADELGNNENIRTENEIENTILDISSAIRKKLNSVEIEPTDFKFIKDIFDSTFYLLTVTQEMDEDIFITFKMCVFIYLLFVQKDDVMQQVRIIEQIMRCKAFLISEDLMVEIQRQIIYCLNLIDKVLLSKIHLELFLSVESVVFLNRKNKTALIQYYFENDVLTPFEKLEVIRTIYYNMKTDYDDEKYTNNQNEYPPCAASLFLEFISNFDTSSEFIEVNNLFKYFLQFEFSLESYANFLSKNNFDVPLYIFLRNFEEDFIIKFYMIFFKKIRTNSTFRSLPEDSALNSKLIINKHIINFCKYFLQEKKENFFSILNAVPYLPSKKEYFFIYYEIWKFVLQNGLEKDLLFFGYKTPALIDLASSFTKEEGIDGGVVERIYKIVKNLDNGIIFNLKNTRLYFSSSILAIIFIVEYEKIRNFNFSGVLEYLEDTSLMKIYSEELKYSFMAMHYTLKTNYLFAVSYVKALLEKFINTFETTKVIILEIIKQIVKNKKELIYNHEINELFNQCITSMNSRVLNQKETKILNNLLTFYKNVFFDNLNKNTPHMYSYLLFCVLDLNLFYEYRTPFKGIYSQAISHTFETFKLIQQFIEDHQVIDTTDPENGDLIQDYISHNDVSWLVDVAFMKSNDTKIVRTSLDILKIRLAKSYNHSDLSSLLKIYNLLEIMEEDAEGFLKESIFKKIDLGGTPSVILELATQTTGFFKFYFSNYYFLLTGDKKYAKESNFPGKETFFNIFSIDDLITLHNSFKKKTTLDILKKTNLYSFRDYFYKTDEFSMCDIISILKNCKRKDLVSIALNHMKSRDIKFYIPQLVQCLKREEIFTEVFLALHGLCKDKSTCHFLLWNLRGNLYDDCSIFKRCINDIENTYGHVKGTEENIEVSSNDVSHGYNFLDEITFFDALTNISNAMSPYLRETKGEKSKRINCCLKRIEVPNGIYLPTDPSYQILKVVDNSGKALQSHAKIPFLASFYCIKQDLLPQIKLDSIDFVSPTQEYKKHGIEIKHLIFKAGDDCRQDMLAIQLISLFKDIFIKANLNIFLFPYQVIAVGLDTGLIEVIPDAITRDQMGRERINNLVDYFEYMYGFVESKKYKEAVKNFVSSLAGYSLVTYFLNIKDRHNGNIMIDKYGHIIHIDFGYMFEISPGNMNIELSVKLTNEIYELLKLSDSFDSYIDLVVKGFYALRRNSKDIVFLVDSCKDSGLPCFKKNAVENLMGRFKLSMNDDEARSFMISTIVGSIGKIRTWVYDKYQEFTNNIAF